MAESVTIARPYAEAVYRTAKESGAQGTWSQRLQRLALIGCQLKMCHWHNGIIPRLRHSAKTTGALEEFAN